MTTIDDTSGVWTVERFQEAVAAGLEVLDQVRGSGWEFDISLADLDLNCPGQCIVGQLFAGYNQGLHVIAERLDRYDIGSTELAVALGFENPTCIGEDVDEEVQEMGVFKLLDVLWEGVIRARITNAVLEVS